MGPEIEFQFHMPVLPPRSVIRFQGEATRSTGDPPTEFALTQEQVLQLAMCLDCHLSLALHPKGRVHRSRRRYCRAARQAARRADG